MNGADRWQEVSPVHRTHEQAARGYDRLSRWYDLLAGRSEDPFRQEGLELLAVRAGWTVLEIGFGTGKAVLDMARRVGETGKVHGIDISAGMVKISRRRLAETGLLNRVRLRQGNALDLPHPADAFDALFMCFTLELFDTPEIPRMLAECRRVLRPAGRVAVVSLSREGGPHPVRRIYEWLHRRLPAVLDCRPIYAGRSLEAGGFRRLESRLHRMWGLPVEVVLAENPL